jgi:hypothetical protein
MPESILKAEYGQDSKGSFVNVPGHDKYRPVENKNQNKRVRQFVTPDKKHAMFVKRDLPNSDQIIRSRLKQNEVDIWNEVHPDHPAKLCQFNGEPVIVMDKLEGEDGADFLNRHRANPIQLLKMLMAAANAIHEFNQKFIHRDARWENLIFNENNNQLEVKLIDFGRAEKIRCNDFDFARFFGRELNRIKQYFPKHLPLQIFRQSFRHYNLQQILGALREDLNFFEKLQNDQTPKKPETKQPPEIKQEIKQEINQQQEEKPAPAPHTLVVSNYIIKNPEDFSVNFFCNKKMPLSKLFSSEKNSRPYFLTDELSDEPSEFTASLLFQSFSHLVEDVNFSDWQSPSRLLNHSQLVGRLTLTTFFIDRLIDLLNRSEMKREVSWNFSR